MPMKPHMYFDKAERKFLQKIKENVPEYAHLEIKDIAHLELKNRLMQIVRERLKNKNKNPLLDAPVV